MSDGKSGRYPKSRRFGYLCSCKRSRMVNPGGTQKVDFLGTCCGDGSGLLSNDILYGPDPSPQQVPKKSTQRPDLC